MHWMFHWTVSSLRRDLRFYPSLYPESPAGAWHSIEVYWLHGFMAHGTEILTQRFGGSLWKISRKKLMGPLVSLRTTLKLKSHHLTCNPSTLGGQGRQITWGQEFESSLTNMEKPCLYYKYKISQAWWYMSVIPATREAEVAVRQDRHCTPAWATKAKLRLKKEKEQKSLFMWNLLSEVFSTWYRFWHMVNMGSPGLFHTQSLFNPFGILQVQ